MKIKKEIIYSIVICIFVITTIVGFTLFINEKYATKDRQISIIKNYYTQMIRDENISYGVVVLKLIADDGEILDLFDDSNPNGFSQPGTLYCTMKGNIITSTNILKVYYDYTAKLVSNGNVLSGHGFLNFKYEVLENGQLFFPDNINTEFQDRNMLTYYFNKNLNIGFQMRLDKLNIKENQRWRYEI